MIPVYLYIVSKDLHDAWYCIVPMVTAMWSVIKRVIYLGINWFSDMSYLLWKFGKCIENLKASFVTNKGIIGIKIYHI
jgi:hypothetical protein